MYGGPWKGNQMHSPSFDLCVQNFERDMLSTTTIANKTCSIKHRRPNTIKTEQHALEKMRALDVFYNIENKVYGAVDYSKELFREKCLLHLED